jgi:hypothetical protein
MLAIDPRHEFGTLNLEILSEIFRSICSVGIE